MTQDVAPRGTARVARRRIALLVCAVIALLAAGVAGVWTTTPGVADMNQRLATRLRLAHARAVPLRSIARPLQEAVVATEDEHFYAHAGVDALGLLRAIPYDLSHGTAAQGGSTITEQLAKQLYLGGNDHTPLRKLDDVVLALKLERRYSKGQILDAYLNTTYFGEGSYGIGAASRRYFGVGPAKLDVARASLLAGLIQAPTSLDPLQHPQAARLRQIEVLRSLVRNKFVSTDAARAALDRPLRLSSGRTLAPVRARVALQPGPTFDWREFGFGLGLVLLASAAAALARRRASGLPVGGPALVLVLLGLWAVVRSFRVA